MKNVIISAILIAFSSVAFAQTVQTGATAGASNTGVNQNINFNSPEQQRVEYSGTQTLKNVPAMGSNILTTSNDTCMGSTSGGLVVAGFGGSLGKTYVDDNCKRLKNSRELWNMGMHSASIKLMCTDEDMRFALEATGVDCGQTKEEWIAAGSKVAVVAQPQPAPVAPNTGVQPNKDSARQLTEDENARRIEAKAAAIRARQEAARQTPVDTK